MSSKTAVISAAIGSLLALGTLGAANAEEGAKEKCYGVAKAGENGCAANGHGCQGQAKADNDPNEWMNVEQGKCVEMGGSLQPGAKEEKGA